MIVIALTDIHGDSGRLAGMADDLRAADLVLVTGDLTHFGHRQDASKVVDAVRALNARVLAVTGNCDHADVQDYLEAEGIALHGRHAVVDGVAFVGLGGSLPCPGRTPNEMSDGRLGSVLAQAVSGVEPGTPLVLVAHQPPVDTTCDLVRGGLHVGSRAVRGFIEQWRPLVCFTGHIHEGRGIDSIGVTQIVNPGPLRHGGYAYAVLTDRLEALEIRGA